MSGPMQRPRPKRFEFVRARVKAQPVSTTAAVAVAVSTSWTVLVASRELLRDHAVLYMPDLWETVLATGGAARGEQFVGAWSRLGLFHPGPAWFYVAAPFFALSGDDPAALSVAAAALVAGSVVGIVVRIWRSVDAVAAVAAAVILAVAVHQLGVPGLLAPWNPTVVIFPLALGLVCAADACARGSVWSTAVAVVAGAFVAQCHIGTLAVGLLLAVGAVAGAAWRRRLMSGRPAWTVGQLVVLAGLFVFPWLPVLVDQVGGTGNGELLARYLIAGDLPNGAKPPSGAQVSAVEVLAQLGSVTALSEPSTASWAGVDIVAGRDHRPTLRSNLVFVFLVLAACGCAFAPTSDETEDTDEVAARGSARRRSRTASRWTCRAGLVALVVLAAGALRLTGQFRPYLVAAGAGVGLVLWIGIGLMAAALIHQWAGQRRPELEMVVGTVGLALGLASVLATPVTVAAFPAPRGSEPVVAAIRHEADGRTVLMSVDDEAVLLPTMKVTWELEAAGTPVAVDGRFEAHFSDRQRRYRPGDPLVLRLVPEGGTAPVGCDHLGSYGSATVCAERERPR